MTDTTTVIISEPPPITVVSIVEAPRIIIESNIGPAGDTGEAGQTGDAGTPGDTGAVGEQGAQGDPGAKGDTGDQGIQGIPGDTGAQGDKGDPGDPATNLVNSVHGRIGDVVAAAADYTADQVTGAVDGRTAGTGGSIPITNVVGLSQAEYDAIGTPDPNTLYLIV